MFHIVLAAKVVVGAAMAMSAHHASQAVTTHVVQSGETLWGISTPNGHNWKHLYMMNRDKIKDPNLIYAGEKIKTNGSVVASTTAVVQSPAPVHHDQFDGKHGLCGDGDNDGMDAPCSVIFPHTAAVVPVRHHSTASASTSAYHVVASSSGVYSFAGLEALWRSAGGPSWAASRAARIAECESGGRTNAYNPSGATGLWQILGSVVPGNLYNAYTNALNAVSKFNASGQTFAQWVCQ